MIPPAYADAAAIHRGHEQWRSALAPRAKRQQVLTGERATPTKNGFRSPCHALCGNHRKSDALYCAAGGAGQCECLESRFELTVKSSGGYDFWSRVRRPETEPTW